MPPPAGVIDEVNGWVVSNGLIDLSTLVLCDQAFRDAA
jgi:hypothetical protein